MSTTKTRKLRPGYWSYLAENLVADQRALALLATLKEYEIPGYVRPTGDPLDPYGDCSARLLDLGLATSAPEPAGTFFDGREEHVTVYRITSLGEEELQCWE